MSVKNPPVKQVAIDDLIPHPRNPRKGNVDVIAESIKVNGFYGVILTQASTGYILAGNHRWKGAKKVGMTHVPVMALDVDDDAALKILLADNRTADKATYDEAELAALLKDVLAASDLSGTGWTGADLDKMIASSIDMADQTEEKKLVPMERTYFLISSPLAKHDEIMAVLTKIGEIDVASSQN
jgi:hypothetical protein